MLDVVCSKIKEDEMDWACSTHGNSEKCAKILVGKPEGKKKVRLGYLCVYGRIILKRFLKKQCVKGWSMELLSII
jgi:hypothetical protein